MAASGSGKTLTPIAPPDNKLKEMAPGSRSSDPNEGTIPVSRRTAARAASRARNSSVSALRSANANTRLPTAAASAGERKFQRNGSHLARSRALFSPRRRGGRGEYAEKTKSTLIRAISASRNQESEAAQCLAPDFSRFFLLLRFIGAQKLTPRGEHVPSPDWTPHKASPQVFLFLFLFSALSPRSPRLRGESEPSRIR